MAAGSGSRMGGTIPKQYLLLLEKPVIVHTLEKFRLFDPEMKIVVVVAPDHRKLWDQVETSYESARGHILVPGGDTRYESVQNGLVLIEKEELVGIHDAVRPLVSVDTLARCYEAAARKGSGIPVLEMDESIRMLDEQQGSRNLDRSRLRRVQTPQVFQSERIKEAYQHSLDRGFTDDASVYETRFGPVNLVEGNRENIKITRPEDLLLASLLIASPE